MIKFILGTAVMAGALTGCATHLEVGHASADDPTSRQGIAYFLPFTQFDTKVTWVVTGCGAEGPDLAVKTEATPKTARDPDHLYTIDYSSLDAWTKTSSVKVDFYDSGAIKSINAAADDRTAEIATKTISAISKIARFAALGEGGGGEPPTCSSLVTNALTTDLGPQKTEVDRLTGLLEQENYVLQAQTARVTRGGDATSPAALQLYDQMIANVVARQLELDIAKRKLAGTMKKLTHTEELTFPNASGVFETVEPMQIPLSVFKKWIGNYDKLGSNVPQRDKVLNSRIHANAIWLKLESQGSWQAGKDFETVGSKSRRAGIRYRIGVPGSLNSCTGASCSETRFPPSNIDRLPVVVLQRGTTFYLPFSSEPFSNGALSATFSEAGILTSAGYEQKRSQGEALAGVADSLADQVVAVGASFRDAKLTKIKQQTDLAKAEKELDTAEKALLASPDSSTALATASLNADTAMKQAEVANIQADIALTNARALRDAKP
jgi:hypothetical protein